MRLIRYLTARPDCKQSIPNEMAGIGSKNAVIYSSLDSIRIPGLSGIG